MQMVNMIKNYLVMITALILMVMTMRCAAQNGNVDLLKSINPQHPDSWYWKQTSASAYWVPTTFCVGMLVYGLSADNEQMKQRALESLISFGGSTLISEILKYIINEKRPGDRYPGVIFPSSPIHGKSFPSGHSVLAFAMATNLALEYKKWYITAPAFLWAGSVGYSRLYLGKHYPTDVLAGGVLGIGSSFVSHWLNQKIIGQYKLKKR